MTVPLEVTGPGEVRLPPVHLLQDRKVVAATNAAVTLWDHRVAQELVPQYLSMMNDLAHDIVVPRLPSGLDRGRPEGWSPQNPIAVGLSLGWALPMTPDHTGTLGLVRPGVVRGWLYLAGFSSFDGLHADPLLECLLSWLAWTAFVGRVNNLGRDSFAGYLDDCAARAGELAAFVPTT
ncbi:hypothetical protein [Geodermatophilus sabuli]|uniref:hypothetical protein n=1 Tax=Geodermatophilus sabuli TaxID=1564158 RepID=UPI00117AC472|nr:hypothetical protein [Geodermatophilus sabuli]MBB3084223.1 hypothetical protein [Geodermatophilus sabuli]